jgi:hypothetical protein
MGWGRIVSVKMEDTVLFAGFKVRLQEEYNLCFSKLAWTGIRAWLINFYFF